MSLHITSLVVGCECDVTHMLHIHYILIFDCKLVVGVVLCGVMYRISMCFFL